MRLAFTAVAIAVSGCAANAPSPSPLPADVRPVGQSALAPKAAASCIATKWATNAGQPVLIENALANDTAFNVYAPAQQPPAGSAAIIRANGSGSSVGFRGTDTSTIVPGFMGQCQN